MAAELGPTATAAAAATAAASGGRAEHRPLTLVTTELKTSPLGLLLLSAWLQVFFLNW